MLDCRVNIIFALCYDLGICKEVYVKPNIQIMMKCTVQYILNLTHSRAAGRSCNLANNLIIQKSISTSFHCHAYGCKERASSFICSHLMNIYIILVAHVHFIVKSLRLGLWYATSVLYCPVKHFHRD